MMNGRTSVLVFVLMLFCSALWAQNLRTVTGTVTDDNGEPLYGATVLLKGSTKYYTMTDAEGRYSIKIPDSKTKRTLQFSFIGLQTVDKEIGTGNVIDATLPADPNVLDEVVITAGYGLAQKRSDMTGSAFQVESKQLKTLPAARIDNLLDGMVPGLTVDETSNSARAKYSIRVRGDASLSANSEPLWIVDGVPIYTGGTTSNGSVVGMSYSVSPLSFINPDDIESMTVLKDAATTSLYGADGANGVIIVTTKSGSDSGKVGVSVSVKFGVASVDKSTLLKLCNKEQWLSLAKEGWANAGYSADAFPYRDNEHNSYSTTDTNWQDVYLGTGTNQQYNVSVNSGSSNARNLLSFSYYNEKSTTKGNSQQRLSVRDVMKYKFGKKFSADVNLNLSYNNNDIFSISSSALKVIPIFSPYDEDGVTPRLYNYYSTSTTEYAPTMRKFVYNYVPDRDLNDNYQRALTLDGNLTLKYDIIDGLSLTSQTGVNYISSLELIYDSKQTLEGLTSSDQDGYSRRAAAFAYVWNNIERINFNRRFGKHNVGALAAIEFVDKESRNLYATGYGFANDHIKEIGYSQSDSRKGYSGATNSRSLSYLAQATYSYDNRYYLSASYRRQGYSSFSTYSRWGQFSSVGLSWNMHNERWYHVGWMDKFKVKASFGNSGNSRVDTSASYGTYTYTEGDYYGGVMGATQGTAPNPGLSWENTYIGNVGLNVSFLKGRIDLEVEGYDKYTTNLLYSGRVSSIITDGSVTKNVGEIENRGLEITLNTVNVKSGDFTWSTMFNGSVNRNTIRKLYKDMHTGFFDYVWVAGASKDAWWLSRWAGVDPTNGSPMWYTTDGDLTYTFTYDNRVLLPQYSKEPDLRGGFQNTFTWGDFSARVMMTYTFGGWDYMNYYDDGYDILNFNTIVEEVDHWREPGDVSANPKFVYKNSTHSSLGSTRFLYSKTNIQLKNVSLRYSLPKDFCRKMRLKSAAVSLIGDNLYMWCPGQSKDHNSYKTMAYSLGLTRGVSASFDIEF